MATLEAGLFFIMLGFAVSFTFISFKFTLAASTGLRMIAMALFLGVAIFVGSGYEVSFTVNHITSQVTINNATLETWIENDNNTDSNVILSGGTDSYWLAWVFSGLGFANLFFIVKEAGFGPTGRNT